MQGSRSSKRDINTYTHKRWIKDVVYYEHTHACIRDLINIVYLLLSIRTIALLINIWMHLILL